MFRVWTSMDGRFSFASCPSSKDINIFGILEASLTAFVKNSTRKGRIAMQPKYASEGVMLALSRTSESLYIYFSVAWFKPGPGVSTRRSHCVPCSTWCGTQGEIPYPRISHNLGRSYFKRVLLQNLPILFCVRFSFSIVDIGR